MKDDLDGFVILAAFGGVNRASPDFLEAIKKNLPDGFTLKIPPALDEETLCANAKDADAILGPRVSRRLILSAPKLRLIQAPGTGVDKIDLDTAIERGITVCNAVGENAVAVSEHAIALMLALAKNLHKYQMIFASGRWVRESSVLLDGKTLGIIGLGSIGTEVAKRVKPFGMKVLALKMHPEQDLKEKLGLAFMGGPDSLGYILGQSDFVLLSPVLTKETKRMIGEKQFTEMKDGAFLVNIARGEIIDENALVNALRTGKLRGAGLDVFQTEPIGPDNPLSKLDNVILTPHVGGGAWPAEATSERIEFIVSNIVKGLTRGRPDNVVDPMLKYAHRN